MSQSTLMGRIGRMFRRSSSDDFPLKGVGDATSSGDSADVQDNGQSLASRPKVQVRTFLRPWAKRDQQIANGFHSLAELIQTVSNNIKLTSQRQEELMGYLSHLPEALQALPESSRLQGETLKAIHMQLAQQNAQQNRLAEILSGLSEANSNQKEILSSLHDRIEGLGENDTAIAENLGTIGRAMESVGRSGVETTRVLEHMKADHSGRERELTTLLQKQNARFTAMLAIAIFLSIAALVAVGVVGYLLLTKTGA